jgi:hypothetical protein
MVSKLFCSHKQVASAGKKKQLSGMGAFMGGFLYGAKGAAAGAYLLGDKKKQYVCTTCGKIFDKKPFGAKLLK